MMETSGQTHSSNSVPVSSSDTSSLMIEYIKSHRGSPLILLNGYLFRKSHTRNETQYWMCMDNRKNRSKYKHPGANKHCLAKLTTVSGAIFSTFLQHNHPPPKPEDIEKRKILAYLKECACDEDSPQSDQTIAQMIETHFGVTKYEDRRRIMRVIDRAKKQHNNKRPRIGEESEISTMAAGGTDANEQQDPVILGPDGEVIDVKPQFPTSSVSSNSDQKQLTTGTPEQKLELVRLLREYPIVLNQSQDARILKASKQARQEIVQRLGGRTEFIASEITLKKKIFGMTHEARTAAAEQSLGEIYMMEPWQDELLQLLKDVESGKIDAEVFVSKPELVEERHRQLYLESLDQDSNSFYNIEGYPEPKRRATRSSTSGNIAQLPLKYADENESTSEDDEGMDNDESEDFCPFPSSNQLSKGGIKKVKRSTGYSRHDDFECDNDNNSIDQSSRNGSLHNFAHETSETKNLSNQQIQRLVLLEKLKYIRMKQDKLEQSQEPEQAKVNLKLFLRKLRRSRGESNSSTQHNGSDDDLLEDMNDPMLSYNKKSLVSMISDSFEQLDSMDQEELCTEIKEFLESRKRKSSSRNTKRTQRR